MEGRPAIMLFIVSIAAFSYFVLPQGLAINPFLFISLAFLFTFIVGNFLERIRIPWIFAALLLGMLLAVDNPFVDITSSETFAFLSQLGMYLLLFIIGFEIDLEEMRRRSGIIAKSTLFIIGLEGLVGSLFVHFVFGYDLLISFVVALSFATVGEAILIPILHEFRMVNTPLGQMIIGIGTLDDLVEILTLILAVLLIGSQAQGGLSISLVLGSLAVIFILAYGLTRLKKEGRRFGYSNIESLFFFVVFVFFLFIGIGDYADTAPLAAIMAGIALGNFLPNQRKELIDREIKAVCYGLFAPIFFIWVGSSLDIAYLAAFPLLVVAITLVSKLTKIAGAYIMARKELGARQSIILGIALSVRFSTSIIIVKVLFDNGLIGGDLYSVIIASSIVFKFLVPTLLSYLIPRWGVEGEPAKKGRRPAHA